MHRVARLICHLPLVASASPGMEERGHPVGTVELGAGEGALEVPQIINGCWQFAGGHGQLSPDSLVEAMHSLAAGGLNAFDTADIYGPSEKIVGQMVKSCDQATPPLVLTKLVPRSNSVGAEAVAATVDRSLAALNVASLDLVQYHTWDYGISGEFLEPLRHLQALQSEGRVKNIGLTNFDTAHMAEAIEHGIPIASNQVQYSLLDRRPENTMLKYAAEHAVVILAYGAVGGGLLSDRWLGKPQPTSRDQLDTSSLSMYFGSLQRTFPRWEDFQTLLQTLREIADEKGVDIAAVAIRYVLDSAAEAGAKASVIVGMRGAGNMESTLRVGSFVLGAQDLQTIREVGLGRAEAPVGDPYSHERSR